MAPSVTETDGQRLRRCIDEKWNTEWREFPDPRRVLLALDDVIRIRRDVDISSIAGNFDTVVAYFETNELLRPHLLNALESFQPALVRARDRMEHQLGDVTALLRRPEAFTEEQYELRRACFDIWMSLQQMTEYTKFWLAKLDPLFYDELG